MTRTPLRQPIRLVHPWAWWGWAIGVAVAVSLTTNPILLALVVGATLLVVVWRRTDAPWARALGGYLMLALTIIAIRLVFQVLMGTSRTGTVLCTLPELHLPAWAAGIRLGGAVTAEALLRSLYESLRLGAMLVCIGAANALANPRRALRNVPPALYELSVAVTIALTLAPQLVESVLRVRRARRLRGGPAHGWRAVRGVVIPVMEDAVERSMALAQGMEARGFGRTRAGQVRRMTTVLLLAGALLVMLGSFAMLGLTEQNIPGSTLGLRHLDLLSFGLLVAGAILTWGGLRSGRRQLSVTHYRPDPWRLPEWLTLLCGVACAVLGVALSIVDPAQITITDLQPPTFHPLMLGCAAAAVAPAFLTPAPPHRAWGRPRQEEVAP